MIWLSKSYAKKQPSEREKKYNVLPMATESGMKKDTSMLEHRVWPQVAAIDSKFFVFDSCSATSHCAPLAKVYDTSTDEWIYLPPLPPHLMPPTGTGRKSFSPALCQQGQHLLLYFKGPVVEEEIGLEMLLHIYSKVVLIKMQSESLNSAAIVLVDIVMAMIQFTWSRILLKMWDKMAEISIKHLKPGDCVYVSGHLQLYTKIDENGKLNTSYQVKHGVPIHLGGWITEDESQNQTKILGKLSRYDPPWIKRQLQLYDSRLAEQRGLGDYLSSRSSLSPMVYDD
ncbi:hypothetical protein C3L33_11754, partial [Rhododendron williamsianum]